MEPLAAKAAVRARLRAQRRARTPEQRTRAAAALAASALAAGPLADALADALAGARDRGPGEVARAPVVAAYRAWPTEPGTGDLVAALEGAGARVLLPVVAPDRVGDRGVRSPVPLHWVDTAGAQADPGELAGARAVLLPALAVDRSGTRLGQGGGHYDTTLAALGWVDRPAGAPPRRPLLAAVVHTEEVLPAGTLVREGHDAVVDAALTPDGWVLLDP